MGTNFYIRGNTHDNDPEFHIGKRSAAGLYCFDCEVTLCKKGNDKIHYTPPGDRTLWWHDRCPSCRKAPETEPFEQTSAGRELGFNKDPQIKTGVRSCSSFSWAMPRERYELVLTGECVPAECPCCGRPWDDPDKIIEDEYHNLYTQEEFKNQVLDDCPIHFTHSVGVHFS